MTTRWLILFRSHPTPPVDTTVVDVEASCMLSAILKAKREIHVQHEWHQVSAFPWPRGCADIEAAAKKIVSRR